MKIQFNEVITWNNTQVNIAQIGAIKTNTNPETFVCDLYYNDSLIASNVELAGLPAYEVIQEGEPAITNEERIEALEEAVLELIGGA
jgi:hypothetical protein